MEQNGITFDSFNQFSYYESHSGLGPPVCKEFTIDAVNRIFKYKLCCLVLTSALTFWFLYSFESCGCFFPTSTIALSGVLIFDLLWTVKTEALLVTVPVGLQLTTTYLLGQEMTHFIPWHNLDDILIIEAISGQRVLYYLAATLRLEKKGHVILFKNTRPRLRCLEKIYKEARCLLDSIV